MVTTSVCFLKIRRLVNKNMEIIQRNWNNNNNHLLIQHIQFERQKQSVKMKAEKIMKLLG